MKKLTVLLVLIFILLNDLYSQEKTTSKEVGLYFSSLNSFGVRYKFGNEKRMFRLTALSLSAERTTSPDQNKAGAGLNFVSYTHLRAHETRHDLVCRLLLEKK